MDSEQNSHRKTCPAERGGELYAHPRRGFRLANGGMPAASEYVSMVGDFRAGGTGRMAGAVAVAVAEHGLPSMCVALRPGGTAPLIGHCVGRMELMPSRGWFRGARGLIALRHALGSLGPAVIHVHGPRTLVALRLAMLGRRRRQRVWFSWHDSSAVLPKGRLGRAQFLWALRIVDQLFGSSQGVAMRFCAALGGGRPVLVFRNGVSRREQTRGHHSSVPVVLWAARFVPSKDPEALLRAVSVLRSEGFTLRVVMAGSAPPHLDWLVERTKNLAVELGVDDVVEFPGWVPDLGDLLDQSSIAVQSSQTEGLSIALLEQMMAGLAVVATSVGDTAVAVVHGESGLLVPAGDHDALVNALRELLASPDLRRRLGTAARERAITRFSLEAVAHQVIMMMGEQD